VERASNAARLPAWAPAAVYLVLALAWTWPLALHLTTRFAHDPGDPLLVTYLLWWDARVVPLSPAMWNAPFFWPMRDALALTEHGVGMGVLTSPIIWLGGSPLLAYNLLLIASAWLSALAVYGLVRRLTGDRLAAFCAGAIWGFCPYRASQLGHIHLLVAWWMPLALLALHAYYEDRRRRWLALFGVSWLLQALTNGYYMFFFPLLVAGWIAVFTRWKTDRRRAAAVIAAWAVFSLPLVPVLYEYYVVQHALGLSRTRTEMQMFSAHWPSFVHFPPLARFWPPSETLTQEDFLFPGVASLGAIVAALLVARRRAMTRAFLFYAGAAVFLTWMAAGPSPEQWSLATLWHIYDWVAWLPGYSGLRVPARFFMLTTLCLAVAAGLGVAALNTTRRRTIAVCAIVCAAAFADGWIVAMPLGLPPRPFGVHLIRGAHVLELPTTGDEVNVAAMYRGTIHGLPVVNGYAGYIPPYANVLEWALNRRDASALTELRRGHPLYVAIANQSGNESWTTFMDAQNDAQMLGVSGGGRLYFLPPAPFPRQVSLDSALSGIRGKADEVWMTLDLGGVHTLRALDLRTRGHYILLRGTVRVETSLDGSTWTLATEEPSGGLALAGVLADPRAMPVRVLLPDPSARFLRINTPAFAPPAYTIYGR